MLNELESCLHVKNLTIIKCQSSYESKVSLQSPINVIVLIYEVTEEEVMWKRQEGGSVKDNKKEPVNTEA